jgi:hypothetical protein
MEKNLKKNLHLKYGDLMKPLIVQLNSKTFNRQAAVYLTSILGFEVVFYENYKEVKREGCIANQNVAEQAAENWVNNMAINIKR